MRKTISFQFAHVTLLVLWLCLVLATSAILIYLGAAARAGVTTFDDAYMFIRYAKHFLAGLGHAWNPDGVQIYGSTSLLHFGVVTLLRAILPFSDATIVLIASAGAGLLAMLALAWVCTRFTLWPRGRHRFVIWAGIVLPLLVINPVFQYHSVTGMDTALALLCNTLLILSVLAFVETGSPPRLLLMTFNAYLAYLARPDNIIFSVLFPSLAIVLLAPAQRRYAVHFLLGLGGIVVVDALVKWLVFGDPLPLAFYAKHNGYYDGYLGAHKWNPAAYLLQFVGVAMPYLTLSIIFATRRTIALLTTFLLPVALTFVAFFNVVQIMGDEARYYLPSLPFVIVAGFLITDDALAHRDHTPSARYIVSPRLVTLVLLYSLIASPIRALIPDAYQNAFLSSSTDIASSDAPISVAPTPTLGWWRSINAVAAIAEKAPPDTTIALSEYGLVGAIAPHVQIIDPLGLHNREVAHNGFSVDRFLSQQPDLIWLPHSDYARIVADIVHADAFWRHYDYYPSAFDYGLALRRDSPRFATLYGLVQDAWRLNYGERDMTAHLAHASAQE